MFLISNSKIITWEKPNRILDGMAVIIDKGIILDIGDQKIFQQKYPQAEIIDAKGQLLMPGNICAHTHFYGAFARGMGIPGSAPDAFPQILEKLWWPLDRSLTLEDVKYSSLVFLVDAIRHGTTTLIDHHASPNAIEGSLDAIASAIDVAGVRAALCYEVTDRGGDEKAKAGIDENVRFINKIKSNDLNGRLAATFGLHASLTLSESTLDSCRKAVPEGIGFHIHVAEHSVDEYDSLAKVGTRVVDRLNKHGLLGPKSIVVHAVHIDAKEIDLLADTKTWVTHQPRSNMNNAVGLPPVESMLRMGIKVGIGTDGFVHTMWEEWKSAYFAHKLLHLDPRRMSGNDVIDMGVYNNADLVNTIFNDIQVGSIVPGANADLILVDYRPFTELTPGNLPWHILFGFDESMITTTMVAGKLLMKDRKLLTLDEAEIAEKAMGLSVNVWNRYKQQF